MSSENEMENTRNRKIHLDTILLEVGEFGKYQMRTIALCMLLVIFIAWSTSEYVFTTGRIGTRCFIPECELDSSSAKYAPPWILNAVPGSSLESFDSCQRYANASAVPSVMDETCPVELFDSSTLIHCDGYVYENTNTVVYYFNLGCDEWRRSLIGSIRTIGHMMSLPLTGFLSDRWGRRTTLVINAVNVMWLGIVRYWAGTYIAFSILEFFEAFLGSGVYSCAYILLTELVGPKYRVLVGAIMSTSFSIGHMLLGLISWAVPYWRYLILTLYIPQVLVISYYWLISESVRWYMNKGRYEESENILKKLASVNGKKLSDKTLTALRLTAEKEKKQRMIDKQANHNEPWLILEIFKHKKILLRCFLTPIWWMTCILIYYGMSVNAVNMSGNSYLNFVAVAAAEIPGHWISVYLMAKAGRKPVLIGSFWFCAICLLAFVFVPNDLPGLSLALYLVGVSCNAMVVIAVYVYTAELYPTEHRHILFAFSSMVGRIGNIIAPLTPAISAATFVGLPFVIFAALAILSGALVFFTPETFGIKLPDTMEEAAKINIKE